MDMCDGHLLDILLLLNNARLVQLQASSSVLASALDGRRKWLNLWHCQIRRYYLIEGQISGHLEYVS